MEESSKKCRSLEEETYWKHFHSVAFCQILSTDFHHHLRLPEKFTEYMRGSLPEKVALKGPNEVTWNVILAKDNEHAMFQGDGWKGFAKAYSLKKADILMFKYNRYGSFEVLLFDGTSLCENEASYFVRKCQKPKDGDDHIGKAMEKPSEFTVRSEERENDSDYPSRNKCRKDMRRTRNNCFSDRAAHTRGGFHKDPCEEPQASDEENCISEQPDSLEVIDGTPKNAAHARDEVPSNSSMKRKRHDVKKTVARGTSSHDICYRSNRRPVTEAEKEKALKMAQEKASKNENPFLVIMRPTSVYKRFFMSIPGEWKPRSVFRKGQEIILRVKEKTWVCKFCASCNSGGLQGGWRQFTRDNFLEEFDVCLFVPAGPKDGMSVLDVSIFRVVPEVISPSLVTPSR